MSHIVGTSIIAHACQDSRHCTGDKGMPDVVLAGRGGLIFAELKSEDGETTPEQDLWIWTLDRAGIRWELWRPIDLTTGIITANMEAIQ
jgi:hypothetical protein